MKDIREAIREITEEFAELEDWKERFSYIIDLGRALPPLPEEYHTDQYKVEGCVSQVWLVTRLNSENRMEFQADSDALLVKGLIALLLQVYSGRQPAEILANPPDFLQATGLLNNLSPSRSNGLTAMVNRIRASAQAFQEGIAKAQAQAASQESSAP